MPTRIAENSIETVTRLITESFQELSWWQHEDRKELIKTANDYGINRFSYNIKKRIMRYLTDDEKYVFQEIFKHKR